MGRQTVDQFQKNSKWRSHLWLNVVAASYANTTRTYPLIISMHGAGETGTTIPDLSKLYNASPRSVREE